MEEVLDEECLKRDDIAGGGTMVLHDGLRSGALQNYTLEDGVTYKATQDS